MRLVLVRHGQTPSNVLGLLDTEPPGPGLTELGRQQADELPEILAGEQIESVYASTAMRAQQTAAPLARALGLEVLIRPGLREIAAGNWEMLDDEFSVRGFLALIGRWMQGSSDERSPGPKGESGREVLQRFDEVVAEVAATGVAGAALVAHGAVNRFWASVNAENLPDDFGASHPLRNAGIVVLSGDPDRGWVVQSWTGADIDGGSVHRQVAAAGSTAGSTDEDPFDDPIPVPGRP